MYYFDERLELGTEGYITATQDFVRDEIQHPRAIFPVWSEAELNAIDIYYATDVTRQNLFWYESKQSSFTAVKVGNRYEITYDITALTLDEQKDILMANTDKECSDIIYANWSKEAQQNAALGLYDEATNNQCRDDISAMLVANQDNLDIISAALNQGQLDAYNPVWPTLPLVVEPGA